MALKLTRLRKETVPRPQLLKNDLIDIQFEFEWYGRKHWLEVSETCGAQGSIGIYVDRRFYGHVLYFEGWYWWMHNDFGFAGHDLQIIIELVNEAWHLAGRTRD